MSATMLSVRIISVDHYMDSPIPELDNTYSEFRGSSIKNVPVIRIFGTTPKGEKTCVHVHGVFPYICVPYDGSEPHVKLSHQLAASLDKAINIASGYSTSNSQHVFKVVLVSGVPMYGYHRKRHQFLKIYFYKPSVIKQAANLLQNGAILNKIFQPHEAHVPFILQFFIDFNLYGMSYVDFQSVKFRKTKYLDLVSGIPAEDILSDSVPPVSLSQLEIDVCASSILNRPSSQGDGQISNPGLAAIWEDENRRRSSRNGTPLEIPNLHSQRPICSPTPSEIFYLRRIKEILDSSSQSSNDNTLSGEPRNRLNMSYAIEEPTNTTALDASFVSFHRSEPGSNAPSSADVYSDDTIVDEDIAQDLNLSISQRLSQTLNSSISQRLSQTLDRSSALDYEDLELLDVLETLADTRPDAIEDESVLGSQTSRSLKTLCSSEDPFEGDGLSEDEDEHWHDKTLVAEEDDALKLLDLTMPDIDPNVIINNYLNQDPEPQPGPSGIWEEHCRIPQVDGVNDLPTKPIRKSLGIRGGISRGATNSTAENGRDARYSARTGDLIFKNVKKPCSATSQFGGILNSSSEQTFLTLSSTEIKPKAKNSPYFTEPSSSTSVDDVSNGSCCFLPVTEASEVSPLCMADGLTQFSSETKADSLSLDVGLLRGIQTDVVNVKPDLHFESQSTIQNTLPVDHESTISFQNTPLEPLNDTQSTLDNTFEDNDRNIMLQYCSDGVPLQDQIVRALQPPVACCTSTAVGCSDDCEEDFDAEHQCVDAYIDMLAKKMEEPLLRGDPSLYPDQFPEKEESLTEFIASEVCKINSHSVELCGDDSTLNSSTVSKISEQFTVPENNLVRRSTRLASREVLAPSEVITHPSRESGSSVVNKTHSDTEELADPVANLSPCSVNDIEVSGIPGFTTTMFQDLRESLDNCNWCSPSSEVTSDSEMCRLSGALQNGQMEEILQSGAEKPSPEPSTSRRDELMLFLESQRVKRKTQLSSGLPPFTDPVTDDLLLRGRKPLAGPPRLGKNMELMKAYCSTPFPKRKKEARSLSNQISTRKELKYALREERRLKLSISAQRKKKEVSSHIVTNSIPGKASHPNKTSEAKSSLRDCSIVVERITKQNINEVCKKWRIKLCDKSALGIKSKTSSSFSGSKKRTSKSATQLHGAQNHKEASSSIIFSPVQVVVHKQPSSVESPNWSGVANSKSSILCSGRSRRSRMSNSALISERRTRNSIVNRTLIDLGLDLSDSSQSSVDAGLSVNFSEREVNHKPEETIHLSKAGPCEKGDNPCRKREEEVGKASKGVNQSTVANNELNVRKASRGPEKSPSKPQTASVSLLKKNRRISSASSNEEVLLEKVKGTPLKKRDGRLSSKECHDVGALKVESGFKESANRTKKSPSSSTSIKSMSTSISKKLQKLPQQIEPISIIRDGTSSNFHISEAMRSYKIPKKPKSELASSSDVYQKSSPLMTESVECPNVGYGVEVCNMDKSKPDSEDCSAPRRRSKRITVSSCGSSVHGESNDQHSVGTNFNEAIFKPSNCFGDSEKSIIHINQDQHQRKRVKKSISACGGDGVVDVMGGVSSVHAEERNSREVSKDGSSFAISLDTSDIKLHLSEMEEKSLIFNEAVPSTDVHHVTKMILPNGCLRVIPCLDGASNESGSNSSSGSHVNDPASVASLKGKFNESSNQPTAGESNKKSTDPIFNNRGREEIRADNSSCWFAQPYEPWSFWSPNNSPRSRHLFSPPRAISPVDNSQGGRIAAIQGCMDQAGPSNVIMTFCEDALQEPLPSQSEENLLIRMTHGETFSGENFNVTSNSGIADSSSRKISQEHSILDIFSENSISSQGSIGNTFQHSRNITIIDLNTSPPGTFDTVDTDFFEEKINLGKKSNEASNKSSEEFKDFSSGQYSKSDLLSSENLNESSSEFQCSQYPGTRLPRQSSVKSLKSSVSSTVFKSLKKPPSRKEIVDSLPSYNIPDVLNQEPFCSNRSDVKGKMEVGGNVLELTSKSIVHLEEFRSSIQGLKGFRHQQERLFGQLWGLSQVVDNFNDLVVHHLNEREALVAPVKKPPKVRDVKLWAKAREILHKKNKMEAVENVVTSQHLQDVSNTQISGSISCFTPVISSGETENNILASTPDLLNKTLRMCKVQSPLFTPILKNKCELLSKKVTHPNCERYSSKSENDEEDLGVDVLNAGVEAETAPSGSGQSAGEHDESSLRRLLLDSQFCRDVTSPVVRHVLDASACQIKGGSSSPGFKMMLENFQNAKTAKEFQYTCLLTLEVHVCTCGTLKPDPERDPIRAVFFSITNDVPEDFKFPCQVNGVIAVNFSSSSIPPLSRCGLEGTIQYAADEKSLLQDLISLVRQWDPDILAGFEVEMLSWGYLVQRASVLGINLVQELSRIPSQKDSKQQDEFEDVNGLSGLKITGRIVLDVWRLFRSEVALQSYSFENLMYHILHERVSCHSFENLSQWWESPTHLSRWITVRYYQERVAGVLRLLNQLDIVGRTSELARLFGIQFFEVLSRGSQFRVESMMLRLAKPSNYIPVSPSVQQRAHMRAPECVALIMEPESRFYSDPVIVLDFQSLYPSMIIAYNYCFSTCLGRVELLGKSSHFQFGCSELRVSNSLLRNLGNNITVSPSGIAFVKKAIRVGVLPRMLEEILQARLAVKQSMKHHKDDPTLQRILHARQLGLKLIANVTYGYTSANFSGRMPCIEVGDSVVSKGRETLQRAIELVHGNNEWRAKVVYGDTDSLFVLVPGRSRQEAFRIGAEIADAVTQDNPSPVKLKLEKVYQPCILQTKKRYVGFMFESPEQEKPVYEAKGIETVRRDGCPAVSKMLEKSLRILFETCDISSVKSYVSRQFSNLVTGEANIQDLIFAREYRGKENYRPGACVPALELAKKWLRYDRRAEPRIGERVPYVVVNGAPGSALIHLVRHPNELLTDPSLKYNAVYYITRAIIPPLARCLSLLGADVLSWYTELPRRSRISLPAMSLTGMKKTISQYFVTMECVSCGELTHGGVCNKCQSNPQMLVTSLMNKLHSWESNYLLITKICQSCCGRREPIDCCSLDCPITYRRHQASEMLKQSAFISQVLNDCGISSSLTF